MRPVAATVFLTDLDRGPDGWRHVRQALLAWQSSGRVMLTVAGMPVDLMSIDRARTAADLPRPTCHDHSSAPFEVIVYDPPLAHDLLRLIRIAAEARGDRPPPAPPPPIGSQP